MLLLATSARATVPHYLDCLEKNGIDAKTATSTVIQTTENGTRRFYPLWATVTATASSSITVAATLSIGTNSSTYDNIVTAATMAGITAANAYLPLTVSVAKTSVAANTDIRVNITVAATGTSQTIGVRVCGFYE